MPPSSYCKPRWIKAGGRSTGHSLAPSTQIQFMNNQSKKCLSEQHCAIVRAFFFLPKHPHGRGEDLRPAVANGPTRETPPRAWGRPAPKVGAGSFIGNTPTGVGKTSVTT